MAGAEPEEIRAELRSLGRRRRALKRQEETLSEEAERALRAAYGVVTVAEASRLLGVHRTTVYRVYHPHERDALAS